MTAPRDCRPPDRAIKVTTRRLCIAIAVIGFVAMVGGVFDALNVALGTIMGLCIAAPIAEPPHE